MNHVDFDVFNDTNKSLEGTVKTLLEHLFNHLLAFAAQVSNLSENGADILLRRFLFELIGENKSAQFLHNIDINDLFGLLLLSLLLFTDNDYLL